MSIHSFNHDETAALSDLWAVYEESFDDVWRTTSAAGLEHPSFAKAIPTLPSRSLDEQRDRSFRAIQQGVAGDWTAYQDYLRGQARTYAMLGVEFEAWYAVVGALGDALSPLLIRRYGHDAVRLAAAERALRRFLFGAMETMAAEYFAEKRRTIEDHVGQLRALAGRLESAREDERRRISREIHDELGQRLTAFKLDVSWLSRKLSHHPLSAEVESRLEAMSALVDSTLQSIRQLATDLRPRVLDDLGLKDALEWQAHQFELRAGIRVHLLSTDCPSKRDSELSTAVFRSFQELLTNVARHARATEVFAKLETRDGLVRLEVRDNGRGILASEKSHLASLGLAGIRERAALLGGSFEIAAAEQGGTVALVTLPSHAEP